MLSYELLRVAFDEFRTGLPRQIPNGLVAAFGAYPAEIVWTERHPKVRLDIYLAGYSETKCSGPDYAIIYEPLAKILPRGPDWIMATDKRVQLLWTRCHHLHLACEDAKPSWREKFGLTTPIT